jgi:hypothetical protein
VIGKSRRRGYILKKASFPNNAVNSIVRAGITRKRVRIK